MSLHGMAVITSVQVLKANCYILFLCITSYFLETRNTIIKSLFVCHGTTLWVISISPLKTCKGNNCRDTSCCTTVNHLCCASNYFILILWIIKSFDIRLTGHAIRSYRTRQVMFFQRCPMLWLSQFDRHTAKLICNLTLFFDTPLFSHRAKTP